VVALLPVGVELVVVGAGVLVEGGVLVLELPLEAGVVLDAGELVLDAEPELKLPVPDELLLNPP